MGVAVEVQCVAQGFEDVEDFPEADLVQVRQFAGATQRQPFDVGGHVRSLKFRCSAACSECHEIVGDELPAQEQRDRVGGTHRSTPFMKSIASLCTSWVAAQVILSSSTPCFSL